MSAGYYRFPTIHENTIVFVSEDDLWSVPTAGGVARRLTSNLGEVGYPMLSPDGAQLAFVGQEEGASEIYVMPADGGSARRLTYLSSSCRVIGWTTDGERILFSSNHGQPVFREMAIFSVSPQSANGEVVQLPYGPARALAFGPDGEVVIGRNTGEPARWKRYRGGTAGHLWIDANGDGQFQRFLADLQGNIASPMWLATGGESPDQRVYFVSDHEGIGNLYSCQPDGQGLRRHTDHEDYYVRNPSSDGRQIVYHVGADLFVYDAQNDAETRVEVDYHSPRVQRNRKFADAGRYADGVSLHPSGKALALTSRGKSFAFYNHEGPVIQYGQRDGVRYRHSVWLNDGRRLLKVSDESGEETLEIYSSDPQVETQRIEDLDIGRVVALEISPVADKVAISNHRHELLVVDLESGELTEIDHSPFHRIAGFDWSPDGRWLAYSFSASSKTSEIRLCRLPEPEPAAADDQPDEGAQPATQSEEAAGRLEIHTITRPVLHDVQPSFDPDGKYLYFLSYREFNPVYDGLHFELGFPWGMRPYLMTLQADLPDPFIPRPDFDDEDDEEDGKGEEGSDPESGDSDETDDDGIDGDGLDGFDEALDEDPLEDEEEGDDDLILRQMATTSPAASVEQSENGSAEGETKSKEVEKGPEPIRIDLDGIERRIVAFPVPDGRYGQIKGIPDKALFTLFPIEGQLDGDHDWDDEDEDEYGALRAYNFKEYKSEGLVDNVSWFAVSNNHKKLLYRSGHRLRVINAGDKPPGGGGGYRKSGWIDLGRIKISIDPQNEWEQMVREAWRLQRDHFWSEDMSQIDWQTVYQRYFPLVARVSTRSEFSDLMWEMQGELGTSHAYEFGGDYRPRPYYGQGMLGAELTWNADAGGYRVGELVLGDPWDARTNSPLAAPGVDVQPGDVIVAINGQPLDEQLSPAQMLVNQADAEVLLTLAPRPKSPDDHDAAGGDEADPAQEEDIGGNSPDDQADAPIMAVVRTIRSEAPARYRRWVEENRQRVHEATDGRVGYVHIPDMGAYGYAEFHRGYLAEVDRDALIVDVRYNGGGHVSQLILEKLARRRIGYNISRWGGLNPYPADSVAGPMVALTNEHAGSDGDIFCHSFKLMQLGPLVGKRTWGGVIGIWPRHALVDGTVTTQPEFSFWFEDVGWNVENYGTDPDIDVDITPQDYVAGQDPQLARSIEEVLKLLAENPVKRPELEPRPSRALPKLPPRG